MLLEAKYGKLTEIAFVRTEKGSKKIYLYKCECGNKKEIRQASVISGNSRSCGCTTHGRRYNTTELASALYGTKLYSTYHQIKQRCNNTKCPRYSDWGGRGIKCLWKSFDDFCIDMYESFKEHETAHGGRKTTIDRIDNNGHYCKENCRWATPKEQIMNQRKRSNIGQRR